MLAGLTGAIVASEKIAAALEEIAGLLEVQQANPFRVRTYRNAAQSTVVTECSGRIGATVRPPVIRWREAECGGYYAAQTTS